MQSSANTAAADHRVHVQSLSRLQTERLLRCADHHARRSANGARLTGSDCDDLRQDIVLETLTRLNAYDPDRSPFGAFVDLLAAHAASRHVNRLIKARGEHFVPFTAEFLDRHCAATADGLRVTGDLRVCTWSLDQRLELRKLAKAVPSIVRTLISILGHPTPRGGQQTSRTTAWRRRSELQLQLRVAGLDTCP